MGNIRLKVGTEASWLAQTTLLRTIPIGTQANVLDGSNNVIYSVYGNGVDDIFDLPRVYPNQNAEDPDFAENWSGNLKPTSKNSLFNLISGTSAYSQTVACNKLGGTPTVHTQTAPINFIADTSNSIVGCWKMYVINANTNVVNFGAGFIKMTNDITPSEANYILFYYDGTNIQVYIQTASTFVYNDPIVAIPNVIEYMTAFETAQVDETTNFNWLDKVSEGVQYYSQSNASFKPTYANPYLTFTRGDYLAPTVNNVFSNKNFLISYVANGNWTADYVVIGHPVVVGNSMRLWHRNGKIVIQYSNSTSYEFTSLGLAGSSTKRLVTIYSDGTNLRLRINGVLNAQVIANSWAFGSFDGTDIIGDDLTLATKGFVGDIGAIVKYNGNPSAGDITAIETELASKFGIAI